MYPELARYIRHTRTLGFSDREILYALIDAGWQDVLMHVALGSRTSDTDAIRAVGISKIYSSPGGDTFALNDVSLAIRTGESMAIVGKSGSGKSTLMHILATLDQPTHGQVVIDGQSISAMTSDAIDTLRNRKFGFVFQQFFLNGRNTCLENVLLPLVVLGMPVEERVRRGYATLEAVGLSEKAHMRANSLSGGQKQRLCIARALIAEPEVIFADEPTGNLDTENGAIITDLLFRLQKERGITLVVVTHDTELANLCDRTVTIKDGVLIHETSHANA